MINRFVICTLLPFICYLAGYFFCAQLLNNRIIITPSVMGMPLQQGVMLLSKKNLRSLVIKEREEVSVACGTILDQIPHAQQQIKENQVVYLTISTQPTQITPSLLAHTAEQIPTIAQQEGLNIRLHHLPVPHTQGQVFGQFPHAGSNRMPGQSVIAYSAITTPKLFIWPNMQGKDLATVQNFLSHYQIKPTILTVDRSTPKDDALIIQQRPVAGSLITLSSLGSLVVQLLVDTQSRQSADAQ